MPRPKPKINDTFFHYQNSLRSTSPRLPPMKTLRIPSDQPLRNRRKTRTPTASSTKSP